MIAVKTDSAWVELPFAGQPLEAVAYIGGGKDADLQFAFLGGRSVMVPVSALRVKVDSGIESTVSRLDDVSLQIEYRAPGLVFHSGRIGRAGSEDDEWHADFREAARSWLEGGCEEELYWVVDVSLHLTTAPVTTVASSQLLDGGASGSGQE